MSGWRKKKLNLYKHSHEYVGTNCFLFFRPSLMQYKTCCEKGLYRVEQYHLEL